METLELNAPVSASLATPVTASAFAAINAAPTAPTTIFLILVPNGNPNAAAAPEVKQFDSREKLQDFMLTYTGPINKLTCYEAYPLSIRLETARG